MFMRHILLVLILISQQFTLLDAGDIVVLSPVSTPSHFMFLSPLLHKLVDRGHTVSIISTRLPVNSKNFTTIELKIDIEIFKKVNQDMFHDHPNDPLSSILTLERLLCAKVCKNYVTSKPIKELIDSGRRFDVAFVTSIVEECGFVIAHQLANHVVYVNFMRVLEPLYADVTGIPQPLAFVPHITSIEPAPLSIYQRINNVVQSTYHSHFVRDYDGMANIIKQVFPEAPSFTEVHKSISMVFSNGDPALLESVPNMPYLVNVGGLHIRQPKSLPQDLNKIIEESGSDGFILFSLGTMIETNNIGPMITQAFSDAFAKLKQTVIWRTSQTISGLSSNVKLVKWMPQQDLLAHPKIRLFVTQGGIFGLQEAIYSGVPVVGVPVFFDQFSNLVRMETMGCAIKLNLFNVTADVVHFAIMKILTDSSYNSKIKHYSTIFHNQPESSLSRAVFWTEYLINHKDLSYLGNPTTHLSFMALHSLDILIFCLFLFITLFVFVYIMYSKLQKCFKNNKTLL